MQDFLLHCNKFRWLHLTVMGLQATRGSMKKLFHVNFQPRLKALAPTVLPGMRWASGFLCAGQQHVKARAVGAGAEFELAVHGLYQVVDDIEPQPLFGSAVMAW